ncbi:MAG: hypothetical protein WCH99_04820 [Verrucomicrobiota bacterium]
MNQNPSVIATGDFLYFAPSGKAFTIPGAGIVSASAKPGPTDPIWTTYALGTVKKPSTDKVTSKEAKIMAPMPGTGIIVPQKIVRTEHEMVMSAEMNEISRLALAGFYKAALIESADDSFHPLGGTGSIEGWLKRQRYDAANGLWIVDDWWVDMNVTDIATGENNIINPKFEFTWLYSALAGSAI